jgi:POT family proton-dependent oligopeptide transporter
MGINVGAVAASLLCGWLGESFGWAYGFGAAGIGMLLGLAVFLGGQRHLHGCAEPADPARLTVRVAGISREAWIYGLALLGVVGVWQVLQLRLEFLDAIELTATEFLALLLASAVLAWFTWFSVAKLDRGERGRMWTLLILIAVSAVFWGIYEQSYISWNTFADRVMNRDALGLTWNASQLTFLGAFFVIVLSPLFAWLWPRLDRLGLNPSTPLKFALALILVGAAMGVMQYASLNPQANGMASIWMFVLAYFVLVCGEMLLSPIGLSAVTTLSVSRVVGLMMGVWFLASAFGEMLAGRFATMAAMDTDAGTINDVGTALGVYAQLFSTLLWIGVGCGALMLLLTPLLNRMSRRD